jgi:hypothetical protein
VDFWGRDPRVRRRVEESLARVESDIANVLRDLPELWPPKRTSRAWVALAYLVAIHVLRTPYAQQRVRALQEASIRRQLTRFPHWTEDEQNKLISTATSDSWRAGLFGDQLTQTAAFIASMHWSLLEFDDYLLATSDQPVSVVPLLGESSFAPVTPMPATGLADCEEIRMALDPRRVLLLTWMNVPDDGPRIRGSDEIAAELNRVVIGQADEQWFHHPSRRATTLSTSFDLKSCGPVARTLFPGYGYDAVMQSQRRMDTLRNLEDMVEEGAAGELRIAGVKRSVA